MADLRASRVKDIPIVVVSIPEDRAPDDRAGAGAVATGAEIVGMVGM